MSSITTKKITGNDCWAGHEDKKHHELRKTPESTGKRKESASPPGATHLPQTTIEQANRRFLKAIVDHWNEREQTSFIQDLTPIMKDYLDLAANGE